MLRMLASGSKTYSKLLYIILNNIKGSPQWWAFAILDIIGSIHINSTIVRQTFVILQEVVNAHKQNAIIVTVFRITTAYNHNFLETIVNVP